MAIVRNDCGGCLEPFVLNTETLTVTMTVPSNGVRGKNHKPAHKVTAEACIDSGDFLILWECPRCEYSDSTYLSAAVRKELT